MDQAGIDNVDPVIGISRVQAPVLIYALFILISRPIISLSISTLNSPDSTE